MSEINERDLEEVAGGVRLPEDPSGRAAQLCVACRRNKTRRCSAGPKELAEYQREHGILESYTECPLPAIYPPKS